MRFVDLEETMNLKHFARNSVSQRLLVSVPFFWVEMRRNNKKTNQKLVNKEKITLLSSSYYVKKLKQTNNSTLFILGCWSDQSHHKLLCTLILVHSAIFGYHLVFWCRSLSKPLMSIIFTTSKLSAQGCLGNSFTNGCKELWAPKRKLESGIANLSFYVTWVSDSAVGLVWVFQVPGSSINAPARCNGILWYILNSGLDQLVKIGLNTGETTHSVKCFHSQWRLPQGLHTNSALWRKALASQSASLANQWAPGPARDLAVKNWWKTIEEDLDLWPLHV